MPPTPHPSRLLLTPCDPCGTWAGRGGTAQLGKEGGGCAGRPDVPEVPPAACGVEPQVSGRNRGKKFANVTGARGA